MISASSSEMVDSGPASLPIMTTPMSSSTKSRQPPVKFKLDLPNSRPTTPAGTTYLVSISFLCPDDVLFSCEIESIRDKISNDTFRN